MSVHSQWKLFVRYSQMEVDVAAGSIHEQSMIEGLNRSKLKIIDPPFRLNIFAGILTTLNLICGCTAKIFVDSIQPNFTASHIRFVDDSGVFLASLNGTFHLKMHNPAKNELFYLCILHSESEAVVWSANRGSPVTNSDEFRLTGDGALLQNSQGITVWSTADHHRQTAGAGSGIVSRMQLKDNGNLVLLDALNASIWESFHNPADTLLLGQLLKSGTKLASSQSENDYSYGDYELLVKDRDLVLIWNKTYQIYWSMAKDSRAVRLGSNAAVNNNSNCSIAYALVDRRGLGLYRDSNHNSSSPVWQITGAEISWPGSLRRAVLDSSGNLRISSYIGGRWVSDFAAIEDECRLPAVCGAMGLCKSAVAVTGSAQCSCPSGLDTADSAKNSHVCKIPGGANYNNNNSCAADSLSKSKTPPIEFLNVGDGYIDYFANEFITPVSTPSLATCQQLCARNCSCVGFFFRNDSRSCFLHDQIGSFRSSADPHRYAYLKLVRQSTDGGIIFNKNPGARRSPLPIVLGLAGASILLLILAAGLVFLYRRYHRTRISGLCSSKPQVTDSESEDREALRTIGGLPRRFSYGELRSATVNFSHKIGSGGFGSVYEGTLPDGSRVAVKKLQSAGQGRKEFYSEIAIIGNIHHVNLVTLRGFCVEGPNRLLVYEFMNRGSLDRSLFGRPVLEWNERLHVALGAARGLAYLHDGCRDKIIHCDIKPENILLDDKSNIKVSDFGLAKLLSREQSHVFTTMRGTRGYLAPEWLAGTAISDKSDVYSYGMLLLEIISGRKNHSDDNSSSIDDQTLGNNYYHYFPAYALQMYEQQKFTDVADPRLEGRVSYEEIEKLVKIALCCVQEDPNLRPSMNKVVHMIEGNRPVEDPRVESLKFLRMYATRFSANSESTDMVPGVLQSDSVSAHLSSSANSWHTATKKNSAPTTGTASPSSSQPYQALSIVSPARLSGPR